MLRLLKKFPMSNNNLILSKEWKALTSHQKTINKTRMCDLFELDKNRFKNFHLQIDGLLFDYSRNRVDEQTVKLLIDLAKASNVEDWRAQLFAGGKLNTSENRAVLHTALRGSVDQNLIVDGENIKNFVDATLVKVKEISEKIRKDKTITDIVNIGIGGSNLGPRMACVALKEWSDGPRVHFVSNVDGSDILPTLKQLKPENTAFIITSKTFTTLETMANAHTAAQWSKNVKDRFFSITADAAKAQSFGIQDDHILPMRDWIGGRTSLWSAAGLVIAVAAGFESFKKLLDGARAMDTHFRTAPLEKNIPVLMGVLGIWYRNFHDFRAHAILPYAQNLRAFPAFAQQLDMESNGKSVNRDGERIDYATGPVVFGETGTNAQHAFLQHLHQGPDITPVDFIVARTGENKDHHRKLVANALAQAQALMHGFDNQNEPHRQFDGNRPSSTLIFDKMDAYHIGMLAALYEHKVFVQGIILNINSFDQWGVELGKTIAQDVLHGLETGSTQGDFDQTTRALMQIIESNQ